MGYDEIGLAKISNQKLRIEYENLRETEIFDLFIQFVESEKDATIFSNEGIEMLINRKLIEKEKFGTNSKEKYRLTDKGIFFLQEFYENR